MPEKDFAVGSVGIPSVGAVPNKPRYLVVLEPIGKSKAMSHFVSLDKPESLNGFIYVKGFFSELSEEDLLKEFINLIGATPKEAILDIAFPWHRVVYTRSLVFNANKPTTFIKSEK